MAYGYDPSKYINDFSWVGKMGDTVGQFAMQMPELIELNKNIKESNKFKQITYSQTNTYIDRLPDEVASNVASSMGLKFASIDEAKEQLKTSIPKFTDTQTNEDYANKLVYGFFLPFSQAAESPAGGGRLTVGERILPALPPGAISESFANTSVGKEDAANRRSLREQEMALGKEGASKAAVVGTDQVRREQAASFEDQRNAKDYQLQQQRGEDKGAAIANIVDNSSAAMDAWSPDFQATDDVRAAAFGALRTKEQDDLRMALNDADNRIREMTSGKNKPTSVDEFYTEINKLDQLIGSISTKADQLSKNKEAKRNNKYSYDVSMDDYRSQIEDLKARKKQLFEAKKRFQENGNYTVEGYNRAVSLAEKEYRATTKPKEEQEMVDAFNNNVSMKLGGFSGGRLGRTDDEERFIDAYKAKFGTMPVRGPDGKYMTQFRGVQDGTFGGIKFNLGGGSAQQTPQPPKVGEVKGGYRFKGGNPADKNSWEKIQ